MDSATSSETFNLALTFQSFDQVALGYTLDTKQEELASISVPTVAKYTVGTSTANQVAIAGLTQDQSIQVQIIDDGNEQQLIQAAYTAGAPSAGNSRLTPELFISTPLKMGQPLS
ncbi:MAG: hypothetical protein HC910_22535 [Spirulinaceae cyanobacterium SM2_1_0]|nr:hypothetical protein [Spirulinaceae cyanobacterium SM2_1_0]